MAQVPTYNGFQVQSNTLPAAQVNAPQQITNVNNSGEQSQRLGQQMIGAGNAASDIATNMQNFANTIRVQDATNKAKEQLMSLMYDQNDGMLNQKGEAALNRQSGMPLTEEYADKFRRGLSDITASLGNDAQRISFEQQANRLMSNLQSAGMQHESNEFKNYSLSTLEGNIKTSVNDIGLNYKNPDIINSNLENIKASVYQQAQLLGKSATWAEAQARTMTSMGNRQVIESALHDGNIDYASSYLEANSKDMNATDILAAKAPIAAAQRSILGYSIAQNVISQFQTQMQPSDLHRSFNIALGSESGNRQFDFNGKTIINKISDDNEAVGASQVTLKTAPEAAKLAGLPYDKDRLYNDENYNKALGFAYFQNMLQKTGGDLSKTYAAYNAGFSTVQNAVAASQKDGTDWLSHMPSETQNYVKKNIAQFNAGMGKPQRPTFLDIDRALQKDPRMQSDPQLYKTTREYALQQYEEQTKAQKQQEDNTISTAIQTMMTNGGNFNDLPPDLRAQIPAEKVDSLMKFAANLRKGLQPTTDWDLYYKLKTDPQLLSQTNLMVFRDKLSDSDFKSLSSDQTQISNNPDKFKTNVQTVNSMINNNLQQIGINPAKASNSKSDAQTIGRVYQKVQTAIDQATEQNGGKLSNDQLRKVISDQFQTVEVKGILFNSDVPIVKLKSGDEIIVPETDKQQIIASLKKYGKPATAETILSLYKRAKGIQE